MRQRDIKEGQTYLFLATENPARKHLEGKPFTVISKKAVFRRGKKGLRKPWRYFNEDGIGARAEELVELPERENPCSECETGEMELESSSPGNSETRQRFKCNNCQHTETFP